MIKTDAMTKTQEDFFNKNIYLSLYCKGSKKVVWGFTMRGSWIPNIAGCPYYHSSYSASNSTRLSSFCSIRRPYITFKLPRGDMDSPSRLRNFFRYHAIGMCHFRYLWNGLCDRHRAEITVMQFRGHSLSVRQSMRV